MSKTISANIARSDKASLQSIHDLSVRLGALCKKTIEPKSPSAFNKFNPNHRPCGVQDGGQFCSPSDAGSSNPLAVPARRIGRTPPDIRTPLQTNQNPPKIIRNTVAEIAAGHQNSLAWTFVGQDGKAGYKCNIFVADVLSEAGIPVGKLHDSWTGEYVPLAGDWGNPNFDIPGWKVLPAEVEPEPGDIVAEHHFFADLIGNASGHMGIVVQNSDGTLATASSSSEVPGREKGKITISSFGFRKDDHAVFRRFVGPEK